MRQTTPSPDLFTYSVERAEDDVFGADFDNNGIYGDMTGTDLNAPDGMAVDHQNQADYQPLAIDPALLLLGPNPASTVNSSTPPAAPLSSGSFGSTVASSPSTAMPQSHPAPVAQSVPKSKLLRPATTPPPPPAREGATPSSVPKPPPPPKAARFSNEDFMRERVFLHTVFQDSESQVSGPPSSPVRPEMVGRTKAAATAADKKKSYKVEKKQSGKTTSKKKATGKIAEAGLMFVNAGVSQFEGKDRESVRRGQTAKGRAARGFKTKS